MSDDDNLADILARLERAEATLRDHELLISLAPSTKIYRVDMEREADSRRITAIAERADPEEVAGLSQLDLSRVIKRIADPVGLVQRSEGTAQYAILFAMLTDHQRAELVWLKRGPIPWIRVHPVEYRGGILRWERHGLIPIDGKIVSKLLRAGVPADMVRQTKDGHGLVPMHFHDGPFGSTYLPEPALAAILGVDHALAAKITEGPIAVTKLSDDESKRRAIDALVAGA